MDKYLVRGM